MHSVHPIFLVLYPITTYECIIWMRYPDRERRMIFISWFRGRRELMNLKLDHDSSAWFFFSERAAGGIFVFISINTYLWNTIHVTTNTIILIPSRCMNLYRYISHPSHSPFHIPKPLLHSLGSHYFPSFFLFLIFCSRPPN